jgi:hypothetical protein
MLACARWSDLQIPGAGTQYFEPALTDPPRFDETDPPRLVETIFEVEGVGMNAIVYEAQG